jgi:YidC/Oxa1 family membrane protein insertase
MEKRVLLAVTLSFLVLAAYQYFFVKPIPRQPGVASSPQGQAVQGTAATASPTAGPSALPGAPGKGQPEAASPAAPAVETLVADDQERDVVVESSHVRAVFSNRGAELKSWHLKDYLDDTKKHPVDLVPPGVPPGESRAFALETNDPVLTQALRTALFKPSATSLAVSGDSRTLTFDYQDAGGVTAKKVFAFEPDGHPYLVRLSVDVRRAGEPVEVGVSGGPGLGDTDRGRSSGGFLSPSYYQNPEAIFQQESSVTRLAAAKIAQSGTHQGRFRYVGVDDHYFLSAMIPGDRSVQVSYKAIPAVGAKGPGGLVAYTARLDQPWRDVSFFLGPKQFDQLARADRELVRAINFGMFDWLVVPLLRALNWVNRYIGNYGWSIIALTVLINLVMWPLRHKSMSSMRKMQTLQPQVKAIQDRYANLKMTDPARQKMNTELMNLYREKGVNPASGCVPMLLTFPVLFAFYAMLSQAIELRGAPFFGWITDLSVLDPLFITPLLMGATMFWQQRMTPSTADPAQQKVMMFMPIMFTVMFLWAPSGLVIYWLVSNLLAIAQQYLTNRMIGPAPGARTRPAPAGA